MYKTHNAEKYFRPMEKDALINVCELIKYHVNWGESIRKNDKDIIKRAEKKIKRLEKKLSDLRDITPERAVS